MARKSGKSSFGEDLEADISIRVEDLQEEFKVFPSLMFAYSEAKADAEEAFEDAKAAFKEAQSALYVQLKSSGEKMTEKHLEALIETSDVIRPLQKKMLKLKRDFETLKNFCDALRAKKDMLIQLGADARKE